jgi:hypothetical protein
MNSDDAVAITDRATDTLLLLFNTPTGHDLLKEKGVDPAVVDGLKDLGLSSICNLLAAIRVARHHQLGPNDTIVTVATDGAEMYGSEISRIAARDHPGGFDQKQARNAFRRYLTEGETGELLELGEAGRRRIFNLGYYTWVEQQGVEFKDFEARKSHDFWRGLRSYLDVWDAMITDFNERTAFGGR